MINIAKLPSPLLFAITFLCGFMIGHVRDASAATTTITCSVAGFNPSQPNTLQYDHSDGTCTLTANAISPSSAQFDIVFFNQLGGPEQFRIGTGAAHSLTAHKGCSMGSFTAAAGANCSSNRSTDGTETATVLIDGENGSTIRMTLSYTLAGGLGNNFTYNSGSVTITTADAASSGSSAAALRAVQGAVTRSQSVIIGQNFGSRVANVAAGPSVGTVPDTTTLTQQFGFASSSLLDDPMDKKTRTEGTTLGGLAMLASFDTSRLAAAQAADSPTDGAEQRTLLSSESPITIWGHGSFTDIENTRNRTGEDSRYDGNVWGYNLGADYRFSSALVAGMSVGYAQTDITTTFENGTYEEDTWNLSPYVIYRPSDMLTFSAIAGYAFGDVSRSRNSTVTGNTDSQSWYLQVDARQTFQPIADSPFRVTGGLGALTSRNTLAA